MDVSGVRRYFDRQAEGYEDKISSGLLGRMFRRERAMVIELLEPRPGETILDAGCGSGFYAFPMMKAGCQVQGVDISPAMVEAARRRGIEARVADLQDFDLGQQYDKVLCCGSLEFCPQPELGVAKLAGHVRPGGRLVVVFPLRNVIGWAYWLYHRTHGLDIHLFSMGEMRGLLDRHGLIVQRSAKPSPFAGVLQCERRG